MTARSGAAPSLQPEGPAPRFSVIIPTFNRGEAILTTIEAVRSQDFASYEIVVVDDGSTDGTASRLAGLTDVRVVTRKNGGISAARNTGAETAHGEYLVPLDDDDVPTANWLSGLDRAIGTTDAGFASCGYRVVDYDTGTEISRSFPHDRGPAFGNKVASLLAGTFAVRRVVYLDIGGFAEGLRCSHQTEFGLRLLPVCDERGWGVASIDEVLIDIRRRGKTERFERNPAKLLEGVQFIIDRHEARLALSPTMLANCHSIVGVAGFRLGQRSVARHHFRAAWQARPLGPRYAARFAISLAPPVARRVWKPSGS
jgi:glycosyltransferase involved in cell wall biosynthesis